MLNGLLMPEIPIIEWDKFQLLWPRKFKQSQHVTLIGPTGCGKTTLATELIKPRQWVVALGTKYKDDTLEKLIKKDKWKRITKWPPPMTFNRVILWPKSGDLKVLVPEQRKVFSDAFADIYKKGGWCVWLDEERYISDHLRMKDMLTLMYVAARSNNISIVGSAQRPRWIPLEAYSQAGHLFIWRTGDEADLIRIGSLNGTDSKLVAAAVKNLPYHAFLYVNLTDGSMAVSQFKPGK